MEAAASTLSSLLSTLRVDGPWTPPGAWELVTPESGAARVSGLGVRPRQEPIYELTSVTDADPVHYGLLKYLFIRSCEPYFNFIKSWIYRASVDDPYEEFLITQTENKDTRGDSSDILDEFALFPLMVIPFHTASNLLHKRTDHLDTSVSDAELLCGDSDATLTCNMGPEKDNDASSTSQEYSDKEDPLESSECSSYTSMDDVEVDSATDCGNSSSSMFSSYCINTGEAKCSLVTRKLLSSQASSAHHVINLASPIDECEKDGNLNGRHVPMHSQNIKHDVVPDALELDYQYSQFSPFNRFMKRTGCSSEKMNSVEEFIYTDHISSAEKVSHCTEVYPLHSESRHPRLLNTKTFEKSGKINQAWNTSIPYNLSLNPILKNPASCHPESDLQHKSKNRALATFDFESVTDPCEVYCGRSLSYLAESVNGTATVVKSSTEPSGQPDCSSKLLQAQARSQAHLTSSGEMAAKDNIPENASGGAFWEKSLQYSDKSKEKTAVDFSSQFDMPLDIVIDKCIIQEILLQYKYVSSFTMKLLEEGFDLYAHLLALRRYHFMELADWADSFIISFYHKELTQLISSSSHTRPELFKKLNFVMRVRYSCLEFFRTL
nr:unnamed protein product [Digitaria exilis]